MRLLSLILVSFLLTACLPPPAKQAASNQKLDWSARNKQLSAIAKWNINGGVAVKQNDKGFTASLEWEQQANQRYVIHMFGPLGGGSMKLTGQPGQVTMTTAKNETFHASSAQALLAEQTGWRLPIENMRYWIRGIPAPGTQAQPRFDQYKHVTQLKQQGWTIDYQRYTAVNGIDLPSKMTITRSPLRVRVVIKSWKIS